MLSSHKKIVQRKISSKTMSLTQVFSQYVVFSRQKIETVHGKLEKNPCYSPKFTHSMWSSPRKIVERKTSSKTLSLSKISFQYVFLSWKKVETVQGKLDKNPCYSPKVERKLYKEYIIKNHVSFPNFLFVCGPLMEKQWKMHS